MNEFINELDTLLLKVQESRELMHLSDDIRLEELKEICQSSSQMISIFELGKYSYSMVACNKPAYAFLGVTEEEINKLGFKYILKIIHQDNISSVYKLVKFFNKSENSNNLFSATWYLKSVNGWEWCYTCIKPAIYNEDGSVKYMLAVGCSINHLLKSKKQFMQFRKDLDFIEENVGRFLSMTEREKQILKLITEEFTSHDIAEKLSISPFTVDTHRKNLIDKLGVKSSVGLAKYALIYNLI